MRCRNLGLEHTNLQICPRQSYSAAFYSKNRLTKHNLESYASTAMKHSRIYKNRFVVDGTIITMTAVGALYYIIKTCHGWGASLCEIQAARICGAFSITYYIRKLRSTTTTTADIVNKKNTLIIAARSVSASGISTYTLDMGERGGGGKRRVKDIIIYSNRTRQARYNRNRRKVRGMIIV